MLCNEIGKIIRPLQSRCTKYDFKPISTTHVRKYIEKVCAEEGWVFDDDEGLPTLVDLVRGDLRTTLILLDSCVVDKHISTERILQICNYCTLQECKTFLDCCANNTISLYMTATLLYKRLYDGSVSFTLARTLFLFFLVFVGFFFNFVFF